MGVWLSSKGTLFTREEYYELLYTCIRPEDSHTTSENIKTVPPAIFRPAQRWTGKQIIDTVLLYPHPRGLPLRYGLKHLAKLYLDRDIQMGGNRGHDSKEDALATGDLVRFKVAEKAKILKRAGWTMKAGVL